LSSSYPGPYGIVTVSLDATKKIATITFDAASGFLLGAAGAVAVNLSTSSFTLGSITGSNSFAGFTPGPYSNVGAGTEGGGFGSFTRRITSFDGYTHSSTEISFTVTNASGWGSASNVLAKNASGYDAAAHVFVCGSSATSSCDPHAPGGAPLTGYAGESVAAVPEPTSIALLGGVLLFATNRLKRRFA
jgi:hypothetical protein